jgi:hypothetical protein
MTKTQTHLRGSLNAVRLNERRFPDKRRIAVANILVDQIHTKEFAS